MSRYTNPILCALILALAAVPDAALAGGSIKGTAKLNGPVPQRRPIAMTADPACEAANPDGRKGDVMIIDAGGGVQNVFVHITEGLGDQKFETPAAPGVLDQHGCMYTPHVLGLMVGQTLEIKNSDPTLHNVHALPANSPQFNNAMPIKDQVIKKKFTAKETMVRMKCDVHPWMSAFIGVVEHPFFAVTGADGSFEIANVPPGTYKVQAWHEALGTQEGSVTVAEGGAATADFTFQPAAPAAGN